jgi:hypothetical protein
MAESMESTIDVLSAPDALNTLTVSTKSTISQYVVMDLVEEGSGGERPTSSSSDHNYSVVAEKHRAYSTVSLDKMDGDNAYTEVVAMCDSSVNQTTINKKRVLYFFAVSAVVVVLLVIFSCFLAAFLRITHLEAQIASLTQSVSFATPASEPEPSPSIEQLQLSLQVINDSFASLQSTLAEFGDGVNDRMQQLSGLMRNAEDFQRLFMGRFDFYPATTCGDLHPSSPPGYYWVRSSNGSTMEMFCDELSIVCGGALGEEWQRVAELDMTNSSQQCPRSLVLRNDSTLRTCVLDITSEHGLCSSVRYPTGPTEYSRVCGRVLAYQFGSPDTFDGTLRGPDPSINTFYVDGVSLTHGNPRQHIWTFAAAGGETNTVPETNCPCINTDLASQATKPPEFVGDDYFCDTGSSEGHQTVLYSDDPLWDGAGCGPLNTCCSFNNPPWFSKQLPQPTADDIEMRVCRDQDYSDENIAIEIVEIFVQ